MSNYRNGKCINIGYDSLSVISRPSIGRGYDCLNCSREQLIKNFEKDRETFGWVDLDTLQVHKPNGMIMDYISDVYLFDTNWDRGQKCTCPRGDIKGKYIPLSAYYSKL